MTTTSPPPTVTSSRAGDEFLANASVTTPVPDEIAERYGLDTRFYSKYVEAMGIPILGSAELSDAAMLEAGYLTVAMLQNAPDIAQRIVENHGRIAVMTYLERTQSIPEHAGLDPATYGRCRGVGGTMAIPVSSCGEEDLLDYDSEPYWAENVFIHEFAHTVHLLGLGAAFNADLVRIYNQSMAAERWQDALAEDGKRIPAYAARDEKEYWAEGVQSYFGCNCDHPDPSHNGVNGREQLEAYDRDLYDLVRTTFGDNPWCYVPSKQRMQQKHLKDLDRKNFPKFSW
ncbi:MAG TPA: hypothetical protein VJT67_15765 [Longimicrobiaceae bacterium]|nr:hypothetical protein [Longimicrobiaceae bacterium]